MLIWVDQLGGFELEPWKANTFLLAASEKVIRAPFIDFSVFINDK
jgi:hypothetical protein